MLSIRRDHQFTVNDLVIHLNYIVYRRTFPISTCITYIYVRKVAACLPVFNTWLEIQIQHDLKHTIGCHQDEWNDVQHWTEGTFKTYSSEMV